MKAGGGLAIVLGIVGVVLTFPQGECNSFTSSATSERCHNVLGTLSQDAWGAYIALMFGGFAVGAAVGAIIAMLLVQLGVFKRSELGIDEDQ